MRSLGSEGRKNHERPWGNYTGLDDTAPNYKVKSIVVVPDRRLSYQRHAKRASTDSALTRYSFRDPKETARVIKIVSACPGDDSVQIVPPGKAS
jgi:hypothetical protein